MDDSFHTLAESSLRVSEPQTNNFYQYHSRDDHQRYINIWKHKPEPYNHTKLKSRCDRRWKQVSHDQVNHPQLTWKQARVTAAAQNNHHYSNKSGNIQSQKRHKTSVLSPSSETSKSTRDMNQIERLQRSIRRSRRIGESESDESTSEDGSKRYRYQTKEDFTLHTPDPFNDQELINHNNNHTNNQASHLQLTFSKYNWRSKGFRTRVLVTLFDQWLTISAAKPKVIHLKQLRKIEFGKEGQRQRIIDGDHCEFVTLYTRHRGYTFRESRANEKGNRIKLIKGILLNLKLLKGQLPFGFDTWINRLNHNPNQPLIIPITFQSSNN